jgi:hypothetical protein
MTANTITIGASTIRAIEGLYSLNDLHKAAGGESKHQPHEFVRIEQTRALVDELSKSGDSRNCLRTARGANGGTYACRELVIAYAAWISAAFHLQVIRVFLNSISPAAIDYTRINPAQQQHLHELVDVIVASGKQTNSETWKRLHRKFHVSRYEDLPTDQFDAACQYLRGKLDGHDIGALVKKHFPTAAPALPAPTGTERMLITKDLATGETTLETLKGTALVFQSTGHLMDAIFKRQLGLEVTQNIVSHATFGLHDAASEAFKQIQKPVVANALGAMKEMTAEELHELSTKAFLQLSLKNRERLEQPTTTGDRLLNAALAASAHA